MREKREKTWVTMIFFFFQNDCEVPDDFEPRCVCHSLSLSLAGLRIMRGRKISWRLDSLTALGSPTISCTSLKTSFAFETLTGQMLMILTSEAVGLTFQKE